MTRRRRPRARRPRRHVVIEWWAESSPERNVHPARDRTGKQLSPPTRRCSAKRGARALRGRRRRGRDPSVRGPRVAAASAQSAAVKDGLAATKCSRGPDRPTDVQYILSKMGGGGGTERGSTSRSCEEARPGLRGGGPTSTRGRTRPQVQICSRFAFRTFIDLKDIHTEGDHRAVTAADRVVRARAGPASSAGDPKRWTAGRRCACTPKAFSASTPSHPCF